MLFDTQQPSQPKGGEQRVSGLGFGDQEADRN